MKTVERLVFILLSLLVLGYFQTVVGQKCPTPRPRVDLVQFIDGLDIEKRNDTSYPTDTRVTAQCSNPGTGKLRGNTNGQICRWAGRSAKWSGSLPTCQAVMEKIHVIGGTKHEVTPEGALLVFVSPALDSVIVRCTTGKTPPQLEAPPHIQIDGNRARVDGGSNFVSQIQLNPVYGTDSGQFSCKKAAGNDPPHTLEIRFKDDSQRNVQQRNCPRDIIQEAYLGKAYANVTWTEPIIQMENAGTELNQTHSPGDAFPIGETEVVYMTQNLGVEVEICSFMVRIIDVEKPTFINCPDDISTETDTGSATAVVTWLFIVALDNSRVTSSPEGNYQSGDDFPTGSTLVSYAARDQSGNENFCNFTVSVVDDEPPTIVNCPMSIRANITDISMDSVQVYWEEPTITDNTVRYSLAPSKMPGERFNYGITYVEYTARDMHDNENSCVFRVEVADKVRPIFTNCPENKVSFLDKNKTTVAVFWERPTPGDNIDLVGPTVPSHTPGEQFGLGNHTVTYEAHDPAGNIGTCVFTVTVKEAQCLAETTSFSEGNLTWTNALRYDLIPSLERCSVYTEKAGSIRALRECVPDDSRGAVWLEPRLNDCGDVRESIDLNDLSKVTVAKGNVMEVAKIMAMTVSNMTSELADNLDPVASIMENIVNVGSTRVEVAEAVIETVDVVITSVRERVGDYGSESENEAPSMRQASSRIVRSLESQISLVARDATALEITQPSLGVNLVTLQGHQLYEETQFFSVLDEDDPDSSILRDGGVGTGPTQQRGDFTGMRRMSDTSITLPSNIGSELLPNDQPVPLRVSFILYQSDSLFPLTNASRWFPGNATSEYSTSGRVISSTVEGARLTNLSEPVVIEFTPHREWNDSLGTARCVFWDFSLANGTGDWSSDGCEYAGFEQGRILCHCNHLTNFAVIMGINEVEFNPIEQFVLDFISAVGCALSIAGVSLTLFTFAVFRNLRAMRSRQILIHLCVSLLCLYVAFISGIDATQNDVICLAVAVVIHYFTLASMFWMGVEARNMYLLLVRVFKGRESKFMAKACGFAWGGPMVIVAVTFGVTFPMGMYRNENMCFLYNGPAQYYGLLLPLGIMLLHNIVTFVLVVRSLVKNDMGGSVNKQQKSQLEKLASRLQNAICMSVLLGLSWGFGFLSIALPMFTFQLLFCIANSIQGFLVFVLFCVRSPDVRKTWRSAMPIECNLRGQTYKIQERARTNIFAVEAWNCPAKLSEQDGPGLDMYMYTSWSSDGSSRWDETKYVSYMSQVSQISNGNNSIRPFSNYSSENGTLSKKKLNLV